VRYESEYYTVEDTKNKKLKNIISNNKENYKYNDNFNKILISICNTLKYYRIEVLVKTNKKHFVFFINKNVKYHNTLKKINLIHYYNENSIKSLNKKIGQFQWISLKK